MKIVRKFRASGVEWRYVAHLVENIQNDRLRQYVDNQISWYVIKACRYRFYDYMLKFLTVIMPTVVIVAQRCLSDDGIWGQAVVLGLATVTSAAGTFLELHEKRIIYRKAAEELKEETARYVNRVGCYAEENCDDTLFLNLQRIVRKTTKQWETIEKEMWKSGVSTEEKPQNKG